MKLDLLAPYYQHIENPSEEIKIKISSENPKSYALTRAPNRMNSDGRINCEGLYEDGVVAVSVSPINPKFRSQIEDGVWPFIECLINKNYFFFITHLVLTFRNIDLKSVKFPSVRLTS